MIGWFILILSVIVPLYATLVAINLNVFVVDASMIVKNRALAGIILNPLSLLRKNRTKRSIMSNDLNAVENILYHKRAVITEKTKQTVAFKKCKQCQTIPSMGFTEWLDDYVCLRCKCGVYYLGGQHYNMRFKWPFSSSFLYEKPRLSKWHPQGQKTAYRAMRALETDWNRLPDMSKRDTTLLTIAMLRGNVQE